MRLIALASWSCSAAGCLAVDAHGRCIRPRSPVPATPSAASTWSGSAAASPATPMRRKGAVPGRRARARDPVRDLLSAQHHARSKDRHRRLVERRLRAGHDPGQIAWRSSALPGLPLTVLHPDDRAGPGRSQGLPRHRPAGRQPGPCARARFPFGFRPLLKGWQLLFFEPGTFQPDPAKSESWNRGAYIVNGPGHCGECHTPRNAFGAPEHDRFLAGTRNGPDGKAVPNITPNQENGIGGWSKTDITFALQTGILPDGDVLGGAMAEEVKDATSHLTAGRPRRDRRIPPVLAAPRGPEAAGRLLPDPISAGSGPACELDPPEGASGGKASGRHPAPNVVLQRKTCPRARVLLDQRRRRP